MQERRIDQRLFGAIIFTFFVLTIISGCSGGSRAASASLLQEPVVIKIVKTPYLLNVSKAFIPQVKGMVNADLQTLVNNNLKATILSFSNPPTNSSLQGDIKVSFYNSSLLGIEFKGDSFTPGSAHPNKLDRGIHIDLTTGRVYKIEDLFKANVDFEQRIKELCRTNESSYRIEIDGLWDGWTNKTFTDSWTGEERAFLLLENSMRVYSIPSYAQGPISGYNVPYSKMMDMINTEGELWKKIKSQKPRLVQVIMEDTRGSN